LESTNWIRLTVTVRELRRLQLSIGHQLKSPNFYVQGEGVNGVIFNFSNTQKALPRPERRIMTY